MDDLRIIHIKKMYLLAQSADPSPPLGTVLGNIGANASTFCIQFNTKTVQLPNYLSLKTTIYIYENKSMSFEIDLPSTSYILSILKKDVTMKLRVADRFHDKIVPTVTLYNVLQIARLKFPQKELKESFHIVMGTVYSMNLTVIRK